MKKRKDKTGNYNDSNGYYGQGGYHDPNGYYGQPNGYYGQPGYGGPGGYYGPDGNAGNGKKKKKHRKLIKSA